MLARRGFLARMGIGAAALVCAWPGGAEAGSAARRRRSREAAERCSRDPDCARRRKEANDKYNREFDERVERIRKEKAERPWWRF